MKTNNFALRLTNLKAIVQRDESDNKILFRIRSIYIYLTVEMSTSGRFRLKGTDVCSLIKISDDDPAISLHFVLALNPWIKSCSRLPPTSPSYCRTRSNRASVSKCHAAAIMLVCTVRSRKAAVSVFFMVIKAAVLDESVHSKNVVMWMGASSLHCHVSTFSDGICGLRSPERLLSA